VVLISVARKVLTLLGWLFVVVLVLVLVVGLTAPLSFGGDRGLNNCWSGVRVGDYGVQRSRARLGLYGAISTVDDEAIGNEQIPSRVGLSLALRRTILRFFVVVSRESWLEVVVCQEGQQLGKERGGDFLSLLYPNFG
jgi:hypothetical protein